MIDPNDRYVTEMLAPQPQYLPRPDLALNVDDIIGFLTHDMDIIDQKIQLPIEIQNMQKPLLQQQPLQQNLEYQANIASNLSEPIPRPGAYDLNTFEENKSSTSPDKWSTMSNISTDPNLIPPPSMTNQQQQFQTPELTMQNQAYIPQYNVNKTFVEKLNEFRQKQQYYPEEQRFSYIQVEILEYLRDILDMMCTRKQSVNQENRLFLIDQLQGRLKDQKIEVDRDQIGRVLDSLKNIQESPGLSQEDKNLFLKRMLATYYKVGFDAYVIREAAWLSKPTWIVLMICYLADAGLSYRQYQEGVISSEEFRHTSSFLSLSKVPSVLGGISGTAVGFVLGSMLLPGAGSVLGSVIGGLAGGLIGDRTSLAPYQIMEDRIQQMKDMKIVESQEIETGEPIKILITNDRYDEALTIIGASENESISSIEDKYLDKMKQLTDEVHRAKLKQDIFTQQETHQKLLQLNRAYRDVRRRRNYSF
ncbi:UNKNOWN [Stylonychia lemnae]|uniref:Glycine zipper domain-containing protein n=1 Tax=Stylonychia lemnae TaxID=5949 RepID=A0A078A0Z8_STYLE|nr:UNKNOWN [Stylonychia lemnae]|eukprot:CDW75795.1 UNKNOWN [Stylonychia lemnae]